MDTVVTAAGTREAELLESTFRHVNNALVNEMLRFCHELDIDLWEVIRCASGKPFGFAPLAVICKPDISDQRESPVVPVAVKLRARGGGGVLPRPAGAGVERRG